MNIVLIGGGHSHSIFLKKFGMNPVRNIKITLISPESLTPYSGMIPGYISGNYTEEECHIDLRHLCNFSNTKFIKDDSNLNEITRSQIEFKQYYPQKDWVEHDPEEIYASQLQAIQVVLNNLKKILN